MLALLGSKIALSNWDVQYIKWVLFGFILTALYKCVDKVTIMVSIKESNKTRKCQISADFAVLCDFGWHRRGDPLKSKIFCGSKSLSLRY